VCKSAYVRFTADYGYDFEVMGVKMAAEKRNLYDMHRKVPEGGCPQR
jgi:hypothetical protein